MLVLTRGMEEEIVINHGLPSEVRIKVTGIKGESVRLGVTAPQEMRIDRLEVAERIVHEGATREQAIAAEKAAFVAQADASVRGAA